MANADLTLTMFRLQRLAVEFNDDWLSVDDEDERCVESYRANADFDLWEAKDEKGCMTKLQVDCYPESGTVITRFSHIGITLYGIFSLDPKASDEIKDQLTQYNSVAILHGIARGVVVSATGSCPGGPFLLPVLNYQEIIETKIAQQNASLEEGCGGDEEEGGQAE
jgi:hypothetical protein